MQPRIGVAWRPIAGSSLIVRGGYGIYRNTGVYEPIAVLLAQQPPLSTTLQRREQRGASAHAGQWIRVPASTRIRLPPILDLRVGYAQNWILLAQRDLPASLAVTATYLGSKGSHLLQEFAAEHLSRRRAQSVSRMSVWIRVPHVQRRFAAERRPRSSCAAGCVTACPRSTQYTLAKATDDAGAFTGVNLRGSAIAQDWRNLDAEQAPSNLRPAASADGAGQVHDGRWCRRRGS